MAKHKATQDLYVAGELVQAGDEFESDDAPLGSTEPVEGDERHEYLPEPQVQRSGEQPQPGERPSEGPKPPQQGKSSKKT